MKRVCILVKKKIAKKATKTRRKCLLNTTADIRGWNFEIYVTFFYSLHKRVENL